ncbi:acetylornithine deacetylase/succinyl-diaminopimelate desuccinylase-like protein [Alkalibacillus filiformis]|uniref:Acetylornithine deacetylase/succinyl-diaminopimelate desuccinylase-like protein n=1 Tax=Alkalibacillus filiformis TaxID=200990 RepID=A0ABU0DPL8_9BACI|nr:dipeptidase [Alkalibacillus filiformis]MDQ0350384.1 acetylornithine deacetylase/succinyl-diaminopimelate desuccinylase-like protein [Alkalibacillus filiformis]
MKEQVIQFLKDNRERHLQELEDFLKIPSISALSEYHDDTVRAAEWVQEELNNIGFHEAKVMESDGKPVVYGEYIADGNAPTVLVYGHYDVQPVDPVHLWDSEPFEPTFSDNKIYARGATDDKGQVFMHLKVMEALISQDETPPVNFKVLIEGEEEIGSPNLPKFAEEHADMLKADLVVVSDSALVEKGKPTITYGLRGLAGIQIDVKGANSDLHSGEYGGGVVNPIHALVKIVDSFRDENNRIQVKDFYRDIPELSQDERDALAQVPFNEDKLKSELGVSDLDGEEGYSYVERTSVRPTLEVNGLYGGFQGEGIKTVLPNEATAKITCRLVPDQNPDHIVEQLTRHVYDNAPKGVEVEVKPFDKGKPYVTPFDHPVIQKAAQAYETVYQNDTAYIRGGGSIPIVAELDRILDVPVVLMGFGLPDENLHAPNEHFHLENFDQGMETLAHYFYLLGE